MGILLVIQAVPSGYGLIFFFSMEAFRAPLGEGSEWRPFGVEIWSSDRVRQRPRLGVGDGVGVAGEVLVLLLADLGLADGVAAVFHLSIFQAFFFSRPHPSFQAIFEVVTGCQDVSEMGPWDESNLRLLLTSLTVFASSSKHPMSPVRFTDFVWQPHKTWGHRHDVVVCSDGGSGG